MKALFAAALVAMAAAAVLGSTSQIFADSEGRDYQKYRTVQIGDAVGTLEITDNTDREELVAGAMSAEDIAAQYPDAYKAKLAEAANNDDRYFLVWKVISHGYDAEADTMTKTIHVLDAGTGEQLIDPITMEAGSGSCGGKYKQADGDSA